MAINLPRNKALFEEITKAYPGCNDVFKWFLSLNEVPRPSHHTDKASEWAIAAAKAIGATAKKDARGNVAIHVPASKGKEGKPSIVLQAHLDMVPTVAAGKEFDFTKDQLEMFLDGPLLRAKGTTLGADDGSGVAIALAIAEDKKLAHAPIEILLTVDEETGLEGAVELKEGELLSNNAKYLINVDSEDFGEICLSCAGAALRKLHIPVKRAPLNEAQGPWDRYTVTIANLLGGHTGVDIHLGHANALKWLGLMLSENHVALEGCPYIIAEFDGGNAHNAVPSKAACSYYVPRAKAEPFNAAMTEVFNALNSRWKRIETKVPTIAIAPAAATSSSVAPLSFASTRAVCQAIASVHHGVWTWNQDVDTLVETSESLSIAHIVGDELLLTIFARSSHLTALGPVCEHLCCIAKVFGGVCKAEGTDMSGWPAEPNSRLAKAASAVFQQVVNQQAKVTSIHAGLECGIIMGKFPKNKMEAISVGPTVKNPHTPDEYLDVKSAVDLYNYLYKLVENLSE